MQHTLTKEQAQNLKNYYQYDSKSKGRILEHIALEFLDYYDYPIIEIKNKDMQYYWGDFIIMDREYNAIKIDVKASHTYNNTDKLALDYEHFIKNTNLEYIPTNGKDNKGYIHHLKADTIIAINPKSFKLYVVNDFKKMQEQIINLMKDYKDDYQCLEYIYGIELSTNRGDKLKDTTIINIPFDCMKSLGADVKEYQLLQEGQDIDILNNDKKNTLCVGSTRAFNN